MKVAGPPSVAVLVSGTGTNLQAIIDAVAAGEIAGRLNVVLSDRADAYGLVRAKAAGVSTRVVAVGPRSRPGYDTAVADVLREQAPDLVVLAGFMRILSASCIAEWTGRMINIHPSLLPRHRGLDTHRRALEAGDAEHGASVHFVTADLDAGPLIIQYRISVGDDDTVASLSSRVHAGEHVILPRAVAWFVDGRLRLDAGQVFLDGRVLDAPVVVEGA